MMLQQYLDGRLNSAMPRIVLRLENELKLAAPVNKDKTAKNRGDLRRSINLTYGRDEIIIFANEIIFYVLYGTKAHIIKAKNKKVLANKKKGIIFGKSVMHPGTRPNPFMQDIIFRKLKQIIMEELAR